VKRNNQINTRETKIELRERESVCETKIKLKRDREKERERNNFCKAKKFRKIRMHSWFCLSTLLKNAVCPT
jgi:hypothetical protein